MIAPKHNRLKLFLTHDINLFAYHLPLDGHSELGNNAQLPQELGLISSDHFGEGNLGWLGAVADPALKTVGALAQLIATRMRH